MTLPASYYFQVAFTVIFIASTFVWRVFTVISRVGNGVRNISAVVGGSMKIGSNG